MSEKIRICLTDDHKMVRTAIRAMLFSQQDIIIDYEAGSAEELLRILADKTFDLVLLDIMMPGMSGMEALSSIKKIAPTQKVCMLSGEASEENIIQSIELGALGFVAKQSPKQDLIEAIYTINKGELFLGKSISKVVLGTYNHTQINSEETLINIEISKRELEVLQLLSDGLSFKEIGNQLFISARTVESHKNNILSKFHLKNTIQLVKYAIKHRIIQI